MDAKAAYTKDAQRKMRRISDILEEILTSRNNKLSCVINLLFPLTKSVFTLSQQGSQYT